MAGPFKLKSGNSPLFKNIGSSPMTKLTDPTAPPTAEETFAESKYGKYQKKSLTVPSKEGTKPHSSEKAKTKTKTKSKDPIGDWLRKAGKQIKGDLGTLKSKVETGAQKLTSKVASDFSKLAKTDVPKKFASDVKTKISKVKSKYEDYKTNRKSGESQWAYNRRKKREAATSQTGDLSPTKHLVGKHPAKDGHTRADHSRIKQAKKDRKLFKKKGLSRKEDIKTVRSGGKSGDKTVETRGGGSKKIRQAQNRINIAAGSKVRHTKTLLGGYKRKSVKTLTREEKEKWIK